VVRLLGDGWDVMFRGKDGGEISGGGWRLRRREKGKRKLIAGKADFVPILSSLLANRLSMKIAPIYRAGRG
jgi:hypothetical protein